MEVCNSCPSIAEEDLRAALSELKTYLDVTEEDLMKIYVLAVRHARQRRSTVVPARSVMTRDVVSVSAGASVDEAGRLLSQHKIKGMPVVDENNRVIGVVSEVDIRRRSAREGALKRGLRSLFGKPAHRKKDGRRTADIMSTPPITIEPDADIKEVAALFDMHRMRRLPVVDADGRLVGIISRGDIIRSMGK